MLDLILTMIAAYDDYGDELNFTKSDIDIFIKKYDIIKDLKSSDCNERGYIILWNNNYISNEKFADLMDIYYIDGKFWMLFDSFKDMLQEKYETEADILDGELEWYPNSYYDIDSSSFEDYWDNYNEETLQEIIKYCDKHGEEIETDDGETILITKENTKIINGDIFINGDIRLYDFIDELSDLRQTINNGILNAQDSADQSKVYNTVVNNFKNDVADFKWGTIKKDGKDVEKVFLNLNDVDWDKIESDLKGEYGEYEFEQANYGSLYHILNEYEFFSFKQPNYDYLYGTIDGDMLNDCVQSQLSF